VRTRTVGRQATAIWLQTAKTVRASKYYVGYVFLLFCLLIAPSLLEFDQPPLYPKVHRAQPTVFASVARATCYRQQLSLQT
jgi:hypothetical protein